MKIVFAQGNPGERFSGTRHNVGFLALDSYVHKLGLTWQDKSKFSALIAKHEGPDGKVLFVKPTTFYNETGKSARSLIEFYGVEAKTDFLVVHDELAIPFGTVRSRARGSDAGNNGIKSINAAIGEHYPRIRIGIWNEMLTAVGSLDFVVSRWNKTESIELHNVTELTGNLIDKFIQGNFESETISLTE